MQNSIVLKEKCNPLFSVAELSLQFECLPNGAPIPGVPRSKNYNFSSSDRQNAPERSLSCVGPSLPVRSRSPFASNMVPSISSMAPPITLPSSDGRGCGLEQLKFIRLVSLAQPHPIFELRKYTFSPDKKIKIKKERHLYRPISTQEQIVLSTTDGDVFAILESHNYIFGVYKYIRQVIRRIKINMETGTVTALTPEEMEEAPVGLNRKIMTSFRVENINDHVNRNHIH